MPMKNCNINEEQRSAAMKFSMITGVLFLLLVQSGLAQQRVVEKSFVAGNSEVVRLDLKFGELITVKAWDKNEVSFRAEIDINGGKLNDALLVNFADKTGYLHVQAKYDKEKIRKGRIEDCPDEDYSTYSWNNGDHYAVCSKIRYTIYIPREAELKVETISADIELIDLRGPVQAKSISGFVDLSWPENAGADISLKTISGEAFTDLETLSIPHKKKWPVVGYELNGTIGAGGKRITLESISGNIYLRKSGT